MTVTDDRLTDDRLTGTLTDSRRAGSGLSREGVYNGIPARELGENGWERPWSGTSGGQCVEMKRLPDGRIAVRQSTDPAGPALIYTPEEIGAFVTGVKNGLADHMTTP